MKLSQPGIALLLLVAFALATGSGCSVVNKIRAKNSLNEGARAYKDGKFAEAQQKFEEALALDPEQKFAPIFIARSIQQQYKPGVDTAENKAKAEEAIAAYKRVLDKDPNNDDAFTAVTYLYRQMRDENQENAWLMQRASLETAPKEKRSDAFTILASKQWNCSYNITDQKENKATVEKGDKVIVEYKKPQNQADFDQALTCINKGLELVKQAIDLNPENANAWSYRTNLLREMAKLSQMEGKADQKANYDRQADEAEATQNRLNDEQMKKKAAAEEAKKSPSPPAS